MYCGCKMNWEVTLGLPYAISLQHQSKPLTTTVSPVVCNQGNHSVVKTTNMFLQCTDISKLVFVSTMVGDCLYW